MPDQPEPRTISYAATWAILGWVGTMALAVVPTRFGAPTWALTLAVAGVALSVTTVAAKLMHGAEMFADMALGWKLRAVQWIRLAVTAHCGWLALFLWRPGLWFPWLLLLSVFAVTEYGFARAHRYLLRGAPVVRSSATTEVPPMPSDDEMTRVFEWVLKHARLPYVSVVDHEPIPHGRRVTVRVNLDGAGKEKSAAKLGPENAEAIAIALSAVPGVPRLHSDWVQVRKLPEAGTYLIVVVTRDVMGDVRPYVDDPTPTSIRIAALVGYSHDEEPQYLPLDRHGREVGQTESGKSSLVHVEFAHLTRCTDACLWVGGAQKLYDLVGEWLDPYMGTDHPLPFDYLANGPHDLLTMLIDAMTIARYRQAVPYRERPNWPAIVVHVDELSFAVDHREVRSVFEGQVVDISTMCAMLAKGSASARVYLHTSSQRSTNDHGGDKGADIFANGGYAAAFMSDDKDEIGRLLGNKFFQLDPPTHRGEFWIRIGATPILVKAFYIQSGDRNRPRLHDGATVSEVSWARRHIRHELDAGSAQIASSAYANRHTRMAPEFERYLTGADFARPTTAATPAAPDPEAASADAMYDAAMAATAHLVSGPSSTAGAGSAVTTLAERRPRHERVADIVDAAEAPMSPGDILTALHAAGDEKATAQLVTNALTRLTRDEKRLNRQGGRYVSNRG